MKMSGRALRLGMFCTNAGLASAYWAALAQERANTKLLHHRFDATASAVTDDIAASMGRFECGLRGGVVTQNGLPTRAQVKSYARKRQVDKECSGARAFGQIWRVVPIDVAAFTAAVPADGDPPSVIHQRRLPAVRRDVEVRTGVVLKPFRRGPGSEPALNRS